MNSSLDQGSSQEVLVANCPASPLVAIYNPWSLQNTSRITVQCYDRNALLGTPKFSLSAPTETDGVKDTLMDLMFSSPHRLVGCVKSSSAGQQHSLVVWDVSRGVSITPRIRLPLPYQLLHVVAATSPSASASAYQGDNNTTMDTVQDHVYALAYHTTTYKLVVFVYHLGMENSNSCQLTRKIKVGSTCTVDSTLGTSSMMIPYQSCVLAVCPSYQALVVRIPTSPKKMKVLHMDTGHVMGKCKIPSLSVVSSSLEGQVSNGGISTGQTSDAMVFSKDGMILALYTTKTQTGGNIFLWDLSPIYNKTVDEEYESENEDEDGGDDSPKHKKKNRHVPHGTCMGILSAHGDALPISSFRVPISMEVEQVLSSSSSMKNPLVLTLFTHGMERKTRLYAFSKLKDSSSTNINHVTSWTCNAKDTKSVLSASFGPSPGQVILLQGPSEWDIKNKDSKSTSSSSSISFSLVSFLNTQLHKEDLSLSIQEGDVVLTHSPSNDKKNEIVKKRKANAMAGQVVIGPGESGSEAFKVSDTMSTIVDKKQKTETVHEEDNFFKISEEEEGKIGDDGQTIEQRLASLRAQLHEEDQESDEEDEVLDQALTTVRPSGKDDQSSSIRFNVKSATSESLETLLRQALASNDDSQLEIALQVVDKKVIENSILGLFVNSADTSYMGDLDAEEAVQKSSDIILSLLSKLVTRLARKPTRAEALAYWIRTILFILISRRNEEEGGCIRMGEMERQVASKLGPLRNLLSERVECLPALLKLEGRLELLTRHRSM